MERLTERTTDGILVKEDYGEKVLRTLYSCYGGKPYPHYTNCEEGYCAMEKLAAYEDAEEQGKLIFPPCEAGDTVYVLRYIVPTKNSTCWDEDRTLIDERKVLPARVVNIKMVKGRKSVKLAVNGAAWIDERYSEDGGYETSDKYEFININVLFSAFGKTVFLTREEAEAKLKEMEG